MVTLTRHLGSGFVPVIQCEEDGCISLDISGPYSCSCSWAKVCRRLKAFFGLMRISRRSGGFSESGIATKKPG